MNTPLYDFVKEYNTKNAVRLHMPGHKGKIAALESGFDITEIDGADVLYNEKGILKESQKNASDIFGTYKTLYSAEGSSLSIRAMLSLIKMYSLNARKHPLVLAGRNAHKVFMTASALLDIDVKWIFPEEKAELLSVNISPSYLEKCISDCEEMPVAVYITSPDYLGNISDIKAMSEICDKYGIILAVDNAHGAYLRFLPENMHPISLGAHMCCDSAHKTLPVLTGGGYLHISEKAPALIKSQAENAMSLFSSTSPSFLILTSLDRANEYLCNKMYEDTAKLQARICELKTRLSSVGYSVKGNEPLKLTLAAKAYGYTGDELAELLRKDNIECEFSDPDYIVFMFSTSTEDDEINRLKNTLIGIEKRAAVTQIVSIPVLYRAMSVKDALFSSSEEISTAFAENRVLASPSVSCPPAVPVAVCGERLNAEAIRCFEYYGIKKINVVKED